MINQSTYNTLFKTPHFFLQNHLADVHEAGYVGTERLVFVHSFIEE